MFATRQLEILPEQAKGLWLNRISGAGWMVKLVVVNRTGEASEVEADEGNDSDDGHRDKSQ